MFQFGLFAPLLTFSIPYLPNQSMELASFYFLCRGIEIDIAYFSLRYTIGTSQFCCRCTIQNEPSIFPGETIFFLTSKIFVLFIVVVISLYGVWYGEVDSLLCISTEREIELFSAEKPLNTWIYLWWAHTHRKKNQANNIKKYDTPPFQHVHTFAVH